MATTKLAGQTNIPMGEAAAAFIASGIGCLVMGLMTTGAVLNLALKDFLTWSAPVGPLSGKVGVAVVVYFISWAVLHSQWKGKDVDFNKMFTITLVLLGIGLLLTFPPFFEMFE